MKKIVLLFFIIFISSVAHAGDSTFSETSIKAAIEDYMKFHKSLLAPELPEETSIEPEYLSAIEESTSQEDLKAEVKEYAESLAEIFATTSGEAYNDSLFYLMAAYLDNPLEREAVELLITEIKKAMYAEIEEAGHHRLWKSAGLRAIDGFLLLCAIELARGVGSKSKIAKGLGRSVFKGLKNVWSRATKKAAKQAAPEAAGVAAEAVKTTALVVRVATSAGWKSGRSIFRNPRFWNTLLGKPGRSRMLRFLAAGALYGSVEDGYKYHFIEQKFDPDRLFKMVQMVALLNMASNVWEFKQQVNADLDKDFDFEKIKNESKEVHDQLMVRYIEHKQSLIKFAIELGQFSESAPMFEGNVPLMFDEDVNGFIHELFEVHPEFKEIFNDTSVAENFNGENENFKNVTNVSFSPLQGHLGEIQMIILSFEQKLAKFTTEEAKKKAEEAAAKAKEAQAQQEEAELQEEKEEPKSEQQEQEEQLDSAPQQSAEKEK